MLPLIDTIFYCRPDQEVWYKTLNSYNRIGHLMVGKLSATDIVSRIRFSISDFLKGR